MKLLVLVCAIWQLSEGSVPYRGVTVGITPYSAPVHALHSQYHAQNIYGQYMYGYATALSAKDEIKTSDGVTRGGYSYIDANGILQTVLYVSDPVNGFRVVASNIPHDVPAVAHARAQHLAAYEHIKAEHAALAESNRHGLIPVALSPPPLAGGVPIVPVRAAGILGPRVAVVKQAAVYAPAVLPVSSQFHAQDNLGQYTYGYAGPLASKTETKTVDGITRGGYSYIDANGILQTVQYVSDPVNGFRVAATNLPKAPSVTLIGPKVSTTVVGPTENAASIAVQAPATDAVVAAPVPVEAITVEQGPAYPSPVIVANSNIPIHAQTHEDYQYVQTNPNNIPQAIEPQLAAVFQPGARYYDETQSPVVIQGENPALSNPSIVHSLHVPTRTLLPPNHEQTLPIASHPYAGAQSSFQYEPDPALQVPPAYGADGANVNPALLPNNQVILTHPRAQLPGNNPVIFNNPQNFARTNPAPPEHLNSPQDTYTVSPVQPLPYRPGYEPDAARRLAYQPVPVEAEILGQSAPNGGGVEAGFGQPSPQDVPSYGDSTVTYQRPETNDGSPETGRLALFVPERNFAQSVDQAAVNGDRDQPGLFLGVPAQAESNPAEVANQAARISEPRISGPTGYYTQNIEY